MEGDRDGQGCLDDLEDMDFVYYISFVVGDDGLLYLKQFCGFRFWNATMAKIAVPEKFLL